MVKLKTRSQKNLTHPVRDRKREINKKHMALAYDGQADRRMQ